MIAVSAADLDDESALPGSTAEMLLQAPPSDSGLIGLPAKLVLQK